MQGRLTGVGQSGVGLRFGDKRFSVAAGVGRIFGLVEQLVEVRLQDIGIRLPVVGMVEARQKFVKLRPRQVVAE